MIIDTHVHLIGMQETNGCYASARMQSGLVFHLLSFALGLRGIDKDELDVAYRQKLHDWVSASEVDAVGVLALDGVYDEQGQLDHERTAIMVSNDYLFDVCDDDPAQLLPIASINPQRADALDELDRVAELGAVALKALPNSQGFDPGSERYTSFWERLASYEIPLLTHTSFEHTIPPLDQSFGKPRRLELPLNCGVAVIAAHCAGSGVAHIEEDFDTWLEMLDEFENLYGDISAMASVSRFPYIHKVLASERALERTILGSDFPVPVSPVVFAFQLGFAAVRELGAIPNPIQRNLEVFRALGVPEGVMKRGADVLRIGPWLESAAVTSE
jgi:hypothetical protein